VLGPRFDGKRAPDFPFPFCTDAQLNFIPACWCPVFRSPSMIQICLHPITPSLDWRHHLSSPHLALDLPPQTSFCRAIPFYSHSLLNPCGCFDSGNFFFVCSTLYGSPFPPFGPPAFSRFSSSHHSILPLPDRRAETDSLPITFCGTLSFLFLTSKLVVFLRIPFFIKRFPLQPHPRTRVHLIGWLFSPRSFQTHCEFFASTFFPRAQEG